MGGIPSKLWKRKKHWRSHVRQATWVKEDRGPIHRIGLIILHIITTIKLLYYSTVLMKIHLPKLYSSLSDFRPSLSKRLAVSYVCRRRWCQPSSSKGQQKVVLGWQVPTLSFSCSRTRRADGVLLMMHAHPFFNLDLGSAKKMHCFHCIHRIFSALCMHPMDHPFQWSVADSKHSRGMFM